MTTPATPIVDMANVRFSSEPRSCPTQGRPLQCLRDIQRNNDRNYGYNGSRKLNDRAFVTLESLGFFTIVPSAACRLSSARRRLLVLFIPGSYSTYHHYKIYHLSVWSQKLNFRSLNRGKSAILAYILIVYSCTVHDRCTHNRTFDYGHMRAQCPDQPDKKCSIMRARIRM